MDANLLHISYEGNALEDPWVAPLESMFTRSVSPEQVRWGAGRVWHHQALQLASTLDYMPAWQTLCLCVR